MIARGTWLVAFGSQGRCAVTLDALRVGAVHRQTGEELGRHAAAAAAVVVPTTLAGPRRLRLAQFPKQRSIIPDLVKTAVGQDVSSEKAIVDGERAGVHVADRVDQ